MIFNPFDWTAGPFLSLYLTVLVLGCLLGFGSRSAIGPAVRVRQVLSEFDLAYLSGGARRFGDAVLLSLMSEHGASIDAKNHRITIDQTKLAALMSPLTAPQGQSNITRAEFQKTVKPLADRVRNRLAQHGYCPNDDQMASFRLKALPFLVLLLLFGVVKVWVGAYREHPVGFLVVLIVFTAFLGIFLCTPPLRTRAGQEILDFYQTIHARAMRAPLDHEFLLAVALSGPVVLSGTVYAPVYAASKTLANGGGGCGGGGDGGGGGCGGCS